VEAAKAVVKVAVEAAGLAEGREAGEARVARVAGARAAVWVGARVAAARAEGARAAARAAARDRKSTRLNSSHP